ncbi:TolC family protein, partial [Parabacteroides sp. OttesenSCG-928-G06]|nr:TolC family protein [Parabacteroides sp. OttesenSCG-928-G06]
MKLKHIVWCGFLCTVALGDLNAQEPMTLEKCRELALEHNKSIAIAERNKIQAAYTRKSYWANYFPKISASGSYLYTNREMNKTLPGSYLPTFVPDAETGGLVPNILTTGSDGNPIFKEYAYFPDIDLSLKLSGTWMAGLQAEQPLFMGGKITSGYKMSKIVEDIAGLNQHLTHAEVIVKTDEAYWTYVQATELQKLALSYQKVVAELLRNVQDAQEVGLKHTNDVLKVQVKLNEAELQLRQAENGVNLSRKNLCHIMGVPLHREVVLPEEIENTPTMIIERDAGYTDRPEYAILEQQVKLKQQQIKLTRSDYLPQVGVMANYGYIDGLKLNGSKLLDRASFSVMASVSIPLFQWGEGRNKVNAAKAEYDIMKLQRDDIGEMMELELIQALDRCDESVLEVQLTTRSLRQAEENMRVSKDMYDAGMETLADYLEAQTAWQQAWSEHINAQTRQRIHYTHYQ